MAISVVFAGSADFGVKTLEALVADDRFDVKTVICNPAKPVGRKQVLTLPPLGQVAEELNLSIYTPANKAELADLVADMEQPDFLVVMAYGMILPQSVLDWPKVAPVNVHPSLLPKYRGAAPIQTTLLNGDFKTGNCYMQMAIGLDDGPLYECTQVDLDGTETAEELFETMSDLSAKELPEVLVKIKDGDLSPVPQQGEPSFCTKITKKDGELNLGELTAEEVINRYRAYTSWPSVYWFDNGKRVIIRELSFEKRDLGLEPSEVKMVDGAVWLGTKTEAISLIKVQPEGKATMAATSWFRGR